MKLIIIGGAISQEILAIMEQQGVELVKDLPPERPMSDIDPMVFRFDKLDYAPYPRFPKRDNSSNRELARRGRKR